MIPRFGLSDGYQVSRIIKGGWHLAGDHGSIDRDEAIRDMAAFVEAGITTFDCADIYTGVEQMIGDFRRAFPGLAERVQVHTKFVPDLADLPRVDRRYVETIVDRSLARLGVDRIDLVQFHWWDYAVPGHVEAALELDRQRAAGKIGRLGVTNFDVPSLQSMLQAGLRFATNQLQYSLLDRRPEHAMVEVCRRNDIALLCYGTVAGGFLSERWLGAAEPVEPLTNRSLVKYKLIIDDFGGWALFQDLLRACRRVANRYGVDIATVASRWALDRPGVAAVIIGARSPAHARANAAVGALRLDAVDRAEIDAVLARRTGPTGDAYALERDRTGRHGAVMQYNLNALPH